MKTIKKSLSMFLAILLLTISCAPLSEEYNDIEDRTDIILGTDDGDGEEDIPPGG